MTGLLANMPRTRARRVLDQSAAIGVAFSDKAPAELLRLAGESESNISRTEFDAFKAKHRDIARRMMDR